jgi:hypothetical protein
MTTITKKPLKKTERPHGNPEPAATNGTEFEGLQR